MRILLTVDPEIPVPPKLYGGIERIVDGIASELRTRGHRVGLAAHPESTCAVDQFFQWPGGASNRLLDTAANTWALLRAVRIFKPDVLHSFSRLGYLLPLLPSRLPKVMSYQRHTGGRQIEIALRLAGRSLKFTGCSEFIAAMGRKSGGDWRAIPNFVDTTFFEFKECVPADAPLVFLSRLEPTKGAHVAIAIAKAANRRLIIAGNRPNTKESVPYWENEIAPQIGHSGIEYIGAVDDKQKNDLLGQAAAMLVPIEWDEPFGIVFAESLACGTPVISCPKGALPEIVQEGQHGFLVRSIQEGVNAIERLPTISRTVCRNRALEFFSKSVVVSQYEALYAEMAGIAAARR